MLIKVKYMRVSVALNALQNDISKKEPKKSISLKLLVDIQHPNKLLIV